MTQPTSKPNPSPWSSRSAGAVGQPPAKPCPTQSGRGATGRTRKKRDDQPSRKDNEDGKEALYRRTVIEQAEQIRELTAKCERLEKELASRVTENSDTVTDREKWVVEFKLKNSRTWKPTGSEPMAKKDAIYVAQGSAETTKGQAVFRARPLTEKPIVFGTTRK
ncbi:hypothetical protein [Pseudomonas aeruginosa]|uniref:hypothetical protein n=1 Tax=Pseudomonas aeruginosa TaxID=287 RepID=UPI00188B09A7|nr:hypothetical protein [Pseudomonas aeruginosa]MBF3194736.1 hypothetical protein [Pseudomonas aeruginosa]MBF3212460.1 hypothetical protein [Pseudomonas aeruginosa]HBO7948310.1 hypothetical protein [Pseudomonas aeruginosa]HDY6043994.1 hypothetical protein [Pseudomonas aeruginosa]